MKAEKPMYAKDPEKIIEAALETLGMTFSDLGKLANIDEQKIRERLRSKNLGVHEWCSLCDALHIRCYDSLSYGYFRPAHKYNIREAVLDSFYRLPINRGFWRLMREILKDAIRAWKYQSTCYGFRLRWRVRRQDTWKLIKRVFARKLRHEDPQAFLREVFGPPRKEVVAVGLRRQIGRPKVHQESHAAT